MFNIRCRNIRNQILKCRAQRDDHIFLVAIGLKEKLNKSAWKTFMTRAGGGGEGRVRKMGESNAKLKKRKMGFIEGDLFFSTSKQRDDDT